MKTIITTIAFFLTATLAWSANEAWTTNLEAAFKQAEKENKQVLVEFTGSDWCPPCIKMRRTVFSKNAFTDKAAKDFILVELDFPRGDKALAKKNEPYAQKYKIEGFPTVILFDSKGAEYHRFFASEHPSIEAFLAYLKKVRS